MRLIAFVPGIFFVALAVYTYTIGSWLPFEFADDGVKRTFYDALVWIVPVGILLSLFFTIRKEQRGGLKAGIVAATCMIALVAMFIAGICAVGNTFCVWYDSEVSMISGRCVHVQSADCGVASGGSRTVEITPFLHFWNIVIPADSVASR
jgi:hypothetical protein